MNRKYHREVDEEASLEVRLRIFNDAKAKTNKVLNYNHKRHYTESDIGKIMKFPYREGIIMNTTGKHLDIIYCDGKEGKLKNCPLP